MKWFDIIKKPLSALVHDLGFESNLADDNPLQGVYFVEFLPSKLVWQDIVVTVFVTFILAILATLYPAWQATRIDPAKVLGN